VRLSGGGKLDPLFAGIKNGEYFYFANSFAAFPKQRNKALCFTSYGQKFASAVREGNFWGVQFHPEKSGKAGQQVIRNFVSICGKNAAIPSIDVMRGKAVRLKQGRRGTEEFFGDPLALAEKYEKAGFPILHIVDLDAAFGAKSQIPLLRRIASQCRGIRVQWGGGIRSVKSARQAFSAGAYRVVFGTAIAVSPKTVRQCAQEFGPDRVSVSLDFAGNPPKLQIKGWKEGADTGLRKAISLAESCCVGGLIISSVDADGMQKGPDLALISKASGIARLPICLAGGIRSPLDAKRALSAGADSVIIGRALYDGMKKSADRLFQQWNYRNSTTRTKSADRLFQRWNIEIPIQK
jgi:phosphoribosylformimino-5-aminoimidazole carboxamide ribotide isomerase